MADARRGGIMPSMLHRLQFSLKALWVIVTVCCIGMAYRTTLPITIACGVFVLSVGVLLMALVPIRIALDAFDRAINRIRGERFD